MTPDSMVRSLVQHARALMEGGLEPNQSTACLPLLDVALQIPTRLVVLVLLAVATLCVIIAFFVIPGGDCQGVQACEDVIDFGHGVGYWLSLITVIAATALAFMRKDATD